MNANFPPPVFQNSPAPGDFVLRGAIEPDFIRDETLAEIFSATVKRAPQRIAMIEGERRISFGEADKTSDRIASHLMMQGIGPGDVVGLFLPRGVDLLLAQIGITKTGAAWLPFDYETPKDRILICLKDCGAKGLLVNDLAKSKLGKIDTTVWSVSAMPTAKKLKGARPEGLSPQSVAYMIYTSGSTGVPKGITISQRNICHYLRSSNALFGITESDVMFQGCSAAFDLSMEEIWIPYLVGATLWVATPEIMANTEALPRRMREAGITVVDTVPTLLAMFGEDAPSLRVVIVGGEACPPSVVERFAKNGCRLFNSYGPTETTVVATVAELHAGDTVTIGKPIANYSAYVVNDALQAVVPGQQGELLIGGPGVAPGYLNRPELTAQKFIANPFGTEGLDPVLYRSGDAVSINGQGQIVFHGRIDDQVKIRGFRVELGEIETAITQFAGVEHAAVVVRQETGLDRLVAFVVAQKGVSPDLAALRDDLRQRLPPYMVPSAFQMIEAVPRLTSGKVDRKALKDLPLADAGEAAESDIPSNDVEAILIAAAKAVFPGQPIKLDLDFFTEMGGHSLLAAQFISKVRQSRSGALITLQDIYNARTLGRVADLLIERGGSSSEEVPPPSRAPWKRRMWCGLAQGLALPFILTLQAGPWLAIFISYSLLSADDSTFFGDIIIVFSAFMAVTLFNYLFVPLAKWLIIGRTRPGVYPLWGSYYYRVWLVQRLMGLVHLKWMQGTPVIRFYMRLLGATIGKEALISEIDAGAIDLIEIGDHASIGGKVIIANARAEGDKFVIGPVQIGDDVMIGSSSVIEDDVIIGNGVELSDLSSIASNTVIPPFESWSGSPARKVADLDEKDLPVAATASATTKFLQTAFYVVLLLLLPPIGILPIVPAFRLMETLDSFVNPILGTINYLWYMPLLALPTAASMVLFTCLFIVAVRWAVLPRLKPGSYSIYSGIYIRKWIVSLATEVMLDTLSSIFATIYMRGWYRLMGARIGRGSEISTNLSGRYDLIDIGEGNFIADDVQLGDEMLRRNWMTLGSIKTGAKVFIGNEAVVPMNYSIAEGALIGVKSRPPEGGEVGASETWFGSPAIQLPVRQRFDSAAQNTFEPSKWMQLGRALFEAFNISLPTALFITLATIGMEILTEPVEDGYYGLAIVMCILVVTAIDLVQLLISVACKWIAMGVYRPTIKPMWSWWALRTEAVAVMYWGMAGKALLENIRGTPFLPVAMRMFGVKIGHGTFMDATDITEFDCVTIGDFVAVNSGACLQTHLYEDRLMKVGRILIGNDVTIGSGSTVLYDTIVGDGAVIGPMTLVMKGEELPENTAWVGSPAQPMVIMPKNERGLDKAA